MLSESEVVEVLLGNDMGEEVKTFINRFRYTDSFWARNWYKKFTEISFTPKLRKYLLAFTYESKILDYKEPENEDSFQQHYLENVILGFEFLGIEDKPRTFLECEDAIKEFDNVVIMEDHAKEYHKIYLKNKKV